MYNWFYVIVLFLKVSLDPISTFQYSPTFCYFSHKYQIVVCKLFHLSELLSFAELVPQLCTEAAPVCLTLTCYYREQCSSVSPLLMCSLRCTQKILQSLFEALNVLGSLLFLPLPYFLLPLLIDLFAFSFLHLIIFSWVINIASFKNAENISCLVVTCALNSLIWSAYLGHKLDNIFHGPLVYRCVFSFEFYPKFQAFEFTMSFFICSSLDSFIFTIQALCRDIELSFKNAQNYSISQGFFISFLLIIIINIIIITNFIIIIIFVIIMFTLLTI